MRTRISLFCGCLVLAAMACTSHRPTSTATRLPAQVDEGQVIQEFQKSCNGCHAGRYTDRESVLRNGSEIFRRMKWMLTPNMESRLIDMPLGLSRDDFDLASDTYLAMVAFVKPMERKPFDHYPVEKLTAPAGFKVSLYATVPGARTMTLAPDGTLYVGTGGFSNPLDRVYRIRDWNGDGKIGDDEVEILADGLDNPNGVAFQNGSLFVAEQTDILEFKDIAKVPKGTKLARAQGRVVHTFPKNARHNWKYLRAGPNDNSLYASVGAPCNVCKLDDPSLGQAAIHHIVLAENKDEIVAQGVRNSQGFDFRPGTGGKEIWFTDNGRDDLGNDFPPDKLNKLSQNGEHFGFPHCNGDNVPDPNEPKDGFCTTATKPAVDLDPHAAALGMRFYRGRAFPTEFQKNIFIAEHGSYNRARKNGYQVVTVNPDTGQARPFITGWLDKDSDVTWGRPVDIQQMGDGALLVSDDGVPDTELVGAIYRVRFVGKMVSKNSTPGD